MKKKMDFILAIFSSNEEYFQKVENCHLNLTNHSWGETKYPKSFLYSRLI